jgi:hypothetical protein
MKPIKKTLIQKELENEEKNKKSPNKNDTDDNKWDERFWILPDGTTKADQGDSPTIILPGVKGKKYKDI